MHAKKLLGIGVMVLSLAFIAGCGSSQSVDTTDDTTTTTTTETKDLNLAQKQCIELMAYALKGAEYQSKGDYNGLVERGRKTEALMKEYKMDDESYEANCNSLITDISFMDKVQNRMLELK